MHNTDVDALVSLDSFLANRFGYSLMFQNSLYKPNQLTVPVLHITSQETNEDTDYAFFKAARFAPAYYVKLKGLTPPDFSAWECSNHVPMPSQKKQLPTRSSDMERSCCTSKLPECQTQQDRKADEFLRGVELRRNLSLSIESNRLPRRKISSCR